MSGKEKMALDRAVFALLALVLLAGLMAAYGIFIRDASFPPGITRPELSAAQHPEQPLGSLEEPADAYERALLTFGGSCTPAAMLGSRAYGTFLHDYAEHPEQPLERLAAVFGRDHLTVAGCSAVFSDSEERKPVPKDTREWYRAPSSAAAVFAQGGIEAVSLACSRTGDYGPDGYADTRAALEACSVAWSDSGHALYRTLPGGVDTAVYGCVYTEQNLPGILAWTGTAAETNDFVVLYLTDTETGPEPSEQKKNAYRACIEAGADLVVGTNEKQCQPAETWGEGYIVYSLGSLLDGASRYPEEPSALLRVEIRSDGGQIQEIVYDLLPCEPYDDARTWSPFLMENGEKRDRLLAFLCPDR